MIAWSINRTSTYNHNPSQQPQHLLAEDDSVLQALLEVLSNTHSCYLLNPEAELLLF